MSEVENAGPENPGQENQDRKMEDQRVGSWLLNLFTRQLWNHNVIVCSAVKICVIV